jgi:hypothetical protein
VAQANPGSAAHLRDRDSESADPATIMNAPRPGAPRCAFRLLFLGLLPTFAPAQGDGYGPPVGELISGQIPFPIGLPDFRIHAGLNLPIVQPPTFRGTLGLLNSATALQPGDGGMCFDSTRRVLVCTSGTHVSKEQVPHYPGAVFAPPLPLSGAVAARGGVGGGGAHGRGAGPRGGGPRNGRVVDIKTVIGTVWQVPGLNDVTGFDFDANNDLVCVGSTGWRYVVQPPGMLLQSIPPSAPLAGAVLDSATDASGRTFAKLDDGSILDLDDVSNPVATGVAGALLAAHPVPVRLRQCGVGTYSVNGPTVAGNAGFAITLRGIQPGAFTLFAVGTGFDPTGLSFPGSGCPLHLTFGGILGVVGMTSNGMGEASLGLPLPTGIGIGPSGFVAQTGWIDRFGQLHLPEPLGFDIDD